MIKFVETKEEAIGLVRTMVKLSALEHFKVGIAGSFASGDEPSSSVDIVLQALDDEGKEKVGDIAIVYKVTEYIKQYYSNKINIFWLDLLESDEEELLDYQANEGIETNPTSVYTNIAAEVFWVDKGSAEDDEEEDEEVSELEVDESETFDDFEGGIDLDAKVTIEDIRKLQSNGQ